MTVVTGNMRFVANHNAGTPADPSHVSADDIAAYMMIDSVAISTATSRAISTVDALNPSSGPSSTADSKGVSSGTRASTADSKAVSGSVNTSTADSKALSGSVNTSIADSKAVSVGAATVTPTVSGVPGFIQSGTGAVLRVLNTKVGEASLSVKDFGAVGNGLSDDTTAIQNAITAAGVAGGVVKIPAGTYKVTGEMTLSSNVTIRGEGPGSIVTASAMSGLRVFTGASKTNITFQDFAISGTSGICISLGACTKVAVRDMRLSGAVTACAANGNNTAGVHVYGCTDVVLEDNYCTGNGFRSETLLSFDLLCNGLDPYGYPRHFIRNNRCLSTDVHANIGCYNIQESEISGNECTGAYTRTVPGNMGYGIMLYAAGYTAWSAVTAYVAGDFALVGEDNYICTLAHTNHTPPNATYWTLLDHAVRDVRVINNYIHAVEGTGIYAASAWRVQISDNLIKDCASVLTEAALPCGGIGIARLGGGSSGSQASITNNRIYTSGRSGISYVGGSDAGGVITSNQIRSASGFAGIHLRGNTTGLRVADNDIQSCTRGIVSTDDTWDMIDVSLVGNRIADTTDTGIYLSKPVNCTVSKNVVTRAGAHGLVLSVNGQNNSVTGNVVMDSNEAAGGTSNIFLRSPQTTATGNVTGNSAALGALYGIYIDTGAVAGSVVSSNVAKNNRTLDYSLPVGTASGGNVDTSNTGAYSLGLMAQLVGGGPAGTQVLMGSSSTAGAVGTTGSQGDSFVATNAAMVAGTAGLTWTQKNASVASWLLVMKSVGDFELYRTAAGTANGNFAAFWGATPLQSVNSAGGLKVNGTFVVKAQLTAVADAASANATDLATAITLVNELKAQLNATLARLRASTGHGLIA